MSFEQTIVACFWVSSVAYVAVKWFVDYSVTVGLLGGPTHCAPLFLSQKNLFHFASMALLVAVVVIGLVSRAPVWAISVHAVGLWFFVGAYARRSGYKKYREILARMKSRLDMMPSPNNEEALRRIERGLAKSDSELHDELTEAANRRW